MASLQEQLLKAGLADKKKAKQISQQKRKQQKIQRKSKQGTVDENKQLLESKIAEKKEKDRELNAQKQKLVEEKAVQAQIQQMISMNVQEVKNGDISFNVTDSNVIKTIQVNESTKQKLLSNKLAVARFEQGYKIIPIQVADKISERDASWIVYRADQYEESVSDAEDDWYADYEIPDDLTW